MAGAIGAAWNEISGEGLSLLVVDDDTWVRHGYKAVAEKLGFTVLAADSPARALSRIALEPPDLILVGTSRQKDEWSVFLSRLRRLHPSIQTIVANADFGNMLTSPSEPGSRNEREPLDIDGLMLLLRQAVTQIRSKRDSLILPHSPPAVLVGHSSGVQKLRTLVPRLASSRRPVLIVGEQGTGKQQLARAIHDCRSPHDLFVTVNCCSCPEGFVERELRPQKTDGTTIFLDQVDELPVHTQAAVVCALQESDNVGSKNDLSRRAPRLIASTRSDLEASVRLGTFRRDLYLRLNAVILRVAALRERREDIPFLVSHLLEQIFELNGRHYTVSAEAIKLIVDHLWPGNISELKASLQHAVAMSNSPVLQPGDFSGSFEQRSLQFSSNASDGPIIPLAEVEKQTILKALERLSGDKIATARLLGIGKTTLYRKLREYGIAESLTSRSPQR